MGRASAAGSMPPTLLADELGAPMENLPPGIHTIPGGEGEGATRVERMVGPKSAASAVSAMGWLASALLAGERGHGRRDTATATAAETIVRAAIIHTERLSAEGVVAGCALVRFSRSM